MSMSVWRLLKDVGPIWFVMVSLILLTLTGLDGAWLARPSDWGISMWFAGAIWAFLPSGTYTSKFRTWRLLPVSSLDLKRAQWWVALGLPLIWIGGSLAVVVGLRLLLGLRTDASGVVELLSVQALSAIAMVALYVGTSSLRRRWAQADRGIGRSGPDSIARAPSAVVRRSTGAGPFGAAAWRARGWAALSPYALAVAAMAVGVGAGLSFWPLVATGQSAAESLSTRAVIVIIVLSAVSMGGTTRAVRALRALPLGAWALTAILQGFVLTATGCAFAAIWFVGLVDGGDLGTLRLIFCAAVPVMGLRLPLEFRFGRRTATYLSLAPLLLLTLARIPPPASWPFAMAGALLVTALIWTWTWREIARGRGAYRAQPVRPLRWRGA